MLDNRRHWKAPTAIVVCVSVAVMLVIVALITDAIASSATKPLLDPPFGANIRVNDDAGSAYQGWPDIAVDGEGNVYAVWQDCRKDIHHPEIFFAQSDDGGLTWSSNISLKDYPGPGLGSQHYPAIVVDRTGNVYVVWDGYHDTWGIYFRERAAGESIWSPSVKIDDTTALVSTPSIAVDGAGNVHVVWTDTRNGDHDIYSSKRDSVTGLWSANIRVNDDDGSARQGWPDTAVDGEGNVYTVWRDERNCDGTDQADIYFSRLLGGDTDWGPNVRINDEASKITYATRPVRVAVDQAGRLYVVWTDDRHHLPYSIYSSHSADQGNTWDISIQVNDDSTGGGMKPDIAAGEIGNVYAVWFDSRLGPMYDIYAARLETGDFSWGSNIRVSDESHAFPGYPAIALDAAGDAYVVWEDQRNYADKNDRGDIYFARSSGPWPPPTYSISGTVSDRNGDPIAGVTISAGVSGSDTTDANGDYNLTGLGSGTYTLTPSKSGYSFTPARRTVNVSQDVTEQNFIGVADGGPPTPFLDLPFDYGDSVFAFVQALQDTDDGGRANSWFDHAYPDSGKNGRLVLYDGRARTKNLYNANLGCYEGRCYDGHNGIDFARLLDDPQNLPIRPAASGNVVAVHTGCARDNPACGGGYGNYVIVDHQNGYFTHYAHLQEVYVSEEGQPPVTTDDTLGIMGSTGRTFGGTHLHFGVHRDNGNGQWDGESVDKPVDPFGWKGAEADPWVADQQGPTSHYLWIHRLPYEELVSGEQGANMTDTTGHIQVTIPPGAFSGQAILELSPVPVAEPSAQLRSTGRSFWLRLLEWLLGGGGLQSATTLQSTTQFTLTKPITLTVTYTDTDVLHLDVAQLALHRWDEEQETWQPLTTTLDLVNHMVTAQTEDLGDFDLQAPLLCATDDLEPDDGYAAARWVWPNDWPLARGLDILQDSDWVRFDAVQGVTYTISTQNLAAGADTVLNLYDVDALTLLDSNDDADGGPTSELVWTAPYTGTFFVETVSAPGGTTDCSATYELTIATIPGDVVADCQVNISDIMEVASRWRLSAANTDPDDDPTTPNYETLFDLDRDGIITIIDIMMVAARWGETCE